LPKDRPVVEPQLPSPVLVEFSLMSNDSVTRAELQKELAELRRVWSSVAETYGGDDPVCENSQEWVELRHQDLTVRSAVGQSFKDAWGNVCNAAGDLFCGEFAKWSAKVLTAAGHDLAAACPDPIKPSRKHGYYGAEQRATLSSVLTGAPDTVEAGKRMIFWAAACSDPERFRRPPTFVRKVLSWTECLAVFRGGKCAILNEPIDWIDAALPVLTAKSTGHDTQADDEFPDEFYKDPDDHWLTPKWLAERYGIPDSRLAVWRDDACPRLAGEKLRAKIRVKKRGGNYQYVYFWQDVEKIANSIAADKEQKLELGELKQTRKLHQSRSPNSDRT